MENEKQTMPPEDDSWLDELLNDQEPEQTSPAEEVASTPADLDDYPEWDFDELLKNVSNDDWNIEDYEPKFDLTDDAGYYTDNGEAAAEPVAEVYNEPEDPNAPVRKVRPKRKKGYGFFGIPHMASMAIWLALAVIIGSSLGHLLWICAADVLAFGRPNQNITITITEQDSMDNVIDKLYEAGLIQYKGLFKLYAELANAEEKISAGTFTLNTGYDYHALVNGLRPSYDKDSVKVVIPEGYTCAQIFALLEEKGVSTVETLEQYAETSEFASYPFLEGVPRGNKYCLEGFLFPDTYEFYPNDTPQRIFHKLLSRFGEQVDEELLAHLVTLNETQSAKMRKQGFTQSYINAHQLTLRDVITMASIVQKESAHSGENYTIASVFYNRLANAGNFPYLNSDATVVYAHGGKTENLDYALNSPYNTYVVKGLPAGPIGNPGKSAIMASLKPAETNYYYFVMSSAAGRHLFASTLKEHQENINSIGK